MPGVELVEVGSTTQAMERALADGEGAAIGSEEGGGISGLPVLAKDIEDNPTNTTRFVVIANADKAANPTGNDKTSLMFGVQDRPGALRMPDPLPRGRDQPDAHRKLPIPPPGLGVSVLY